METLLTVTLTPEAQELIAFSKTFLATAEAIIISTPQEAQLAVDQTRAVKECAKALDECRKEMTRPLDEQKTALIDTFRPAVDTLAKAEQLLKGAIGAWNAEQARIAAEQEKERQRLAKIERDRQEAEQASAAELLRQAEQASAAGDFAAAEALEERAAAAQEVAAPIALPATFAPAKTRGAASRTIWKCKVINPTLVPRDYCMPNQTLLDALAASTKGAGPAPAGCEWTSTTSTSIR